MRICKFFVTPALILLSALSCLAQTPTLYSWQDTVSNSIGQVIPSATVIVLSGTVGGAEAVNTTTQPGTPLATIYTDPYGASPVNQTTAPITTRAGNGTFQFWAAAGYYVVQIFGRGITGQVVYGISLGAAGAHAIAGTIAAGQTAYGSAADTIAGGTITLDMAGIAGADLGAKMNNCITQLAGAPGVCDGSNLTGALTLSTAVNSLTATTFKFCGQQITQTAGVILSNPNHDVSYGYGGGLIGCPGFSTTFTKGGNLAYQVEIDEFGGAMQYITLAGAKGSGFTGSGLHVTNQSQDTLIANNLIYGQASDDIDNEASNTFLTNNTLYGWGVSAITSNSGAILTNNDIVPFSDPVAQGPNTSTGPAIDITSSSTLKMVGGNLDDNGPVAALRVVGSATLTTVNILQTNQFPAYSASGGSVTTITGSSLQGGGTGGPAINIPNGQTTIITDNTIGTGAADAIFIEAQPAKIADNVIVFYGGNGTAGIHFSGSAYDISNNWIQFNNGESPTGDNYAIWLDSGLVGGQVDQSSISHNHLVGTANSHDIGIFNDNSGAAVDENNTFDGNYCSAMKCIQRSGAGLTNYYLHNVLENASILFVAGGSAQDVIFNPEFPVYVSMTFAGGLPTAGDGSQIWCADCTQFTPTTGGGNGAEIFNRNGVWGGSTTMSGSNSQLVEITGNLSPTTVIGAGADTGSYLVTIYTEVTTGVATSTITASITYADDTGTQHQTGVLFSAASTGTIQSLTFPVRFIQGTALTYQTTTVNSPKYKIFARALAQ
jgi:hypothetical protein